MQLNLQQLSNVLRAESHFLKFKYEIISSQKACSEAIAIN